MNKCKGCQWHNKPYWSIINPCDSCPRESTNIEIFTRWVDPTIEEYEKEIDRLNNIINELEKTFVNDDKRIKEYNIEHPERPLDNYSNYYLDKLKELKEDNK